VKVAVLSGGVGAARFLTGLRRAIDPLNISAIVNTGDDLELHGLSISPDIDTITYTLANAIDPDRGWGLNGETWRVMDALGRFERVRPRESLAAPTWFGLGDKDLATHFYRTARLSEGASLTQVTAEIARAWNVDITVLPMTNQRFRTMIKLADTADEVSFQDYFVRLRHSVAITGVRFEHAGAQLTDESHNAIAVSDVVVVAPSNPVVSVGPIRVLPGVDRILADRRESVVAVSPIVGGSALKGPADRMLAELDLEPTVVGVARLYAPIASALVIDPVDANLSAAVEAEGIRCVVEPSIMSTPEKAQQLAVACLDSVS
jgi:LPPG:FO 2-phospho-L-lactate transferase